MISFFLSLLVCFFIQHSAFFITKGYLFASSKVKVKAAQSCPTFCDPVDSMEFSRPEYWSGLSSVQFSHSVVSDSLWPHGLHSPWNSPGQNTGVGSLSLLQGIFSNPEIEPWSPALWADCLPAEPQVKPEYWSGKPIPSPAHLPNPGVKPGSPALQEHSLQTELWGKPEKLIQFCKV